MAEPTSVETQLAVINTKLDLLLVGRDDHESRLRVLEADRETPEERADRENRIRRLEQFKWIMVGAAAAAGGAAGQLASRL